MSILIIENTPPCAEQSKAVTAVRESLAWAELASRLGQP